MKQIHRAYKFRLSPTMEQQTLLAKHFGCSRFIYNYFLNKKIKAYEKDKTNLSCFDNCKSLTSLKKENDTIWLKEVNAQSLQQSLRDLDSAYNNFFNKYNEFPKFKSKHKKNSFMVSANVKVIDNKILFDRCRGGIKVNVHREIIGIIRSFTISKTTTNKYYVSINTIQDYTPLKKTNKVIGIDLGLKSLIITSNGFKYDNNKYTKQYAKQLRSAQKHLSRKIKGSNGFERQRFKVALIHEKIANVRHDTLHKISNELVSKYDVICIEDLNVKGMMKNKHLSKAIADASWNTFISFIEYKSDWNDKAVIKIDRFFASSKMCSNCNNINKELKLSDRKWTCISCNVTHDRDINAGINILNEGLKIHRQEMSITKVEKPNKTLLAKHISMKPQIKLLV